jgi:hypothetical protein
MIGRMTGQMDGKDDQTDKHLKYYLYIYRLNVPEKVIVIVPQNID